MARLFLDANVFLYAIGADSAHRAPCRDVLLAVGQGKLDGITSSEVLQEVLHVRSRRVSVADAAGAVRAAAELVAEVLPVTSVDVLEACNLPEAHSGLGPDNVPYVEHGIRLTFDASSSRQRNSHPRQRVKHSISSASCTQSKPTAAPKTSEHGSVLTARATSFAAYRTGR